MRKPVFDVTPETMWDYQYQAQRLIAYGLEILASNSLINLKNEIKNRGWRIADLTVTKGNLSYGQNVVNNYPYKPRYKSKKLFN